MIEKTKPNVSLQGFVKGARDDIERLESLFTKMTGAYQDLCDYLAMDSKKCPLNEFFTDLKSFCTLFLSCLQENRLWREQEEKAKRAQNAKQLAEQVRNRTRPEAQAERNAFFKPSKSLQCFPMTLFTMIFILRFRG